MATKRKPSEKALFDATKRGDIAGVTRLIDRGADIEAQDKEGWTPLHYACMNGRTDIARLLLDRGADIEARDMWSYTPLHR
ncbi:MAG TPA: ankyrin repeat domain-containing protein, partial [Synergistales bacterium]|nr:ankyrin repeat domain-containing protein [Synergistales bacterium]